MHGLFTNMGLGCHLSTYNFWVRQGGHWEHEYNIHSENNKTEYFGTFEVIYRILTPKLYSYEDSGSHFEVNSDSDPDQPTKSETK